MTEAYAGVLSVRRVWILIDAETIYWRYVRAIHSSIAVVGFNFKPNSATIYQSDRLELTLNSNRDANTICDSP